jgi:hypothetical protein
MKTRTVLLVGSLGLVSGLVVWHGSMIPSASAGTVTGTFAAASASSLFVVGLGDAEFVGSAKCKKCHLAEHKGWEKTPHATALEALKPGNAAETKTKFKLDPAKDYSKDAACIVCHTVGFGKPGGYQVPADEEAAKKVKALEGVGCEACHGAGGKYMDLHEEIMKSKRKYKEDEMLAAGVIKPDATVCTGCHNEKGPTHDPAVKFDFAAMKEKGAHAATPLKQRE